MSLVNRVSAFFLLALALILAGYSAVFYALVSQQLHEQFDQQLHGALHMLAAAIEVEIDDVKFEPSDHTIHLGSEDGLEDIRWAIFDEAGLLVAKSENLKGVDQTDRHLLEYGKRLQQDDHDSRDLGDWRVLQQRLVAVQPKPKSERDPLERGELVVTVGRSPTDLNANLQMIGLQVTLLPLAAWLIAAIIGRLFVSAALRPVTTMASDARAMSTAATSGGLIASERLPVADTRDELADLGLAFNTLLDQMFAALAQQQRFTGDAAHQLRTPLAALRGQIEVALRRPRSPEEHAQTLQVLLEQTVELQQIVEGLLFLARAEGQAALPETETIHLQHWLPEFLRRWQDHPRFADLRLETIPVASVVAPAGLLGQLVENLISNALKYSPANSPIEIEVRVREAERVILSVQDRGAGVPANERTAIFEPFYRSPAARQSGISGTGLGLAIAARIAKALRGELTCEPVDGPGSCFVLDLPAHPAD
ncbi:sensor histidine kinase [Anatilimnocola sp. NA78]|uniref:sensor histidine kinase n=1 Tax=Anatilimnocola sp. NA78 TaxID=3415683 RepID=UPI003CE47557